MGGRKHSAHACSMIAEGARGGWLRCASLTHPSASAGSEKCHRRDRKDDVHPVREVAVASRCVEQLTSSSRTRPASWFGARRVSVAAGANPTCAISADLDGDGHLDLAIAAAGTGSTSTVSGDFNEDGRAPGAGWASASTRLACAR
jgi:hypothetical protein